MRLLASTMRLPDYGLAILKDDTVQLVHDHHSSRKAYPGPEIFIIICFTSGTQISCTTRDPSSTFKLPPFCPSKSFLFVLSSERFWECCYPLPFVFGVLLSPVDFLISLGRQTSEFPRGELFTPSTQCQRWLQRGQYFLSLQPECPGILHATILFTKFRK